MTDTGSRGVLGRRRWYGLPEYLSVVLRYAPPLVAIAVITAASVYGISETAPKRYEAASLVAKRGTDLTSGTTDVQALQRDLATSRTLATTRAVLVAAAGQVPDESPRSISDGLRATVDPRANLVRISFRSDRRRQAAHVANVVTNTFLAVRAAVIRAQLGTTAAALRLRLRSVVGQPQQQQIVAAIRRRLGELAVSQTTAEQDLFVVEPAVLPTSALPSHSLRNATITLGITLLLGLVILLTRQRVLPRAYGASQLSALLDLPLLPEITHNPRRRGRGGRAAASGEHEGYQALRAALEMNGTSGDPFTVIVTSATHGEGKTTLTANLGRALQQAGYRVLLVAADARQPALHTALGIEGSVGFSDVLRHLRDGSEGSVLLADTVTAASATDENEAGSLSLVPPGTPLIDPGPLFTPVSARALFTQLHALPYDYVLVDTPHLPGFVDGQVLAAEADVVLIVARVGNARVDALLSMRQTLDRLSLSPWGLVVVGTPTKVHRPPRVDAELSAPAGAPEDASVKTPVD